MSFGRVESIFGVLGLVIVVLVVLLGVTRVAQTRARRRARDSDAYDFMDDGDAAEDDGRPIRIPQFQTFADALRDYVVPLREAQPGWDRLDGAVGLPGRASFRFERDGIRFEVNGETRIEPLLAARAWLEAHPDEDALEVLRTGRVGKLRLRREIWPNPRDVRIETT